MVQYCSRCRRSNPDQAIFCHFDGIPLRQGMVAPTAAVAAGAELVFPTGRRCRTFDDLVQGCQAEWDAARQLLQQGELTKFLQRLGRADLVRACQDAATQPDADIALYNFIQQLPTSAPGASAAQVPGAGAGWQIPKLDLHPRRISLKKVAMGERPQVQLSFSNQGRGVLQGKIMVSEGQEWLRFAGGDGRQTSIKAPREQNVGLRVDTRSLVGGQKYTGRLTVITNGGIAEIPVRLDLAAVPFAQPPYKGAGTPRELAQRMLANPKPAVALLESGDVARWFAANGWNYPVAGEPARGVAAVQQFFECLGLSKPPPLKLSDYELRLQCVGPRPVAGEVTLSTNSRKWVFGQVECDAPWLRVTTPSVSGPQQTRIAFEVDAAKLAADQVHQASLVIRANGSQKLLVRVKAEVKRQQESALMHWLRPILVGAILALVLRSLLVIPADVVARRLGAAEGGSLRWFVLATWWLGGLAGFLVVGKKGGHWADRVCGLIAGSGAGVLLGSVLGCLLILADSVTAAMLPSASRPALWFLMAGLTWLALGAALGLVLALIGGTGLRALRVLAAPLAGLCRLCGLDGLARWFAD